MTRIDLTIPLGEGKVLDEPAQVALTVHLPEPGALPERPVVCFGKPGGGYSMGYYTEDLPGPVRGAQAQWHAERGWIFVSWTTSGSGKAASGCASRRRDAQPPSSAIRRTRRIASRPGSSRTRSLSASPKPSTVTTSPSRSAVGTLPCLISSTEVLT
jgi:hypothetical protein